MDATKCSWASIASFVSVTRLSGKVLKLLHVGRSYDNLVIFPSALLVREL